jgi:hypothetical protein
VDAETRGIEDGTSDEGRLADALQQSRSAEFGIRIDAAFQLRPWVQRPETFQRLVAMLDDEDTAVTEAAVDVLANGEHPDGLAAVINAMVVLHPSNGDHIQDKLINLWFEGLPLPERLDKLVTSHSDGAVHDGAVGLLEQLHRR